MSDSNNGIMIKLCVLCAFLSSKSLFVFSKVLCTGGEQTCFINSAKELRCWGGSTNGENGRSDGLEIGDTANELIGMAPLATSVDQVVCGDGFTCFSDTSNGVKCFGKNTLGELGRGNTNSPIFYKSTDPVVSIPATSASTFFSISTMSSFSCASFDSKIYCWGFVNDFLLGIGSTPSSITVPLGVTPVSISVGSSHFCFKSSALEAYCWGSNTYGQLGLGVTGSSISTPTKLSLTNVGAIKTGLSHTCVEIIGSKIACFGNNLYSQLGDGSSTNKGRAASDISNLMVTTLLGKGAVFAGGDRTCIVSSDTSKIYCIGNNSGSKTNCATTSSTVGDSLNEYPPNLPINVPIAASAFTTEVAVGDGSHICVTDLTNVYCWGSNAYGQLGIGGFSLSSCSSSTSFSKACFDASCKVAASPPATYVPIAPFIGPIISFSIFFICFFIACIFGINKRSQFDSRAFLLPNGGQVTGSEIWRSYSHPLSPMNSQPISMNYNIAATPKV